MRDCPNAEIRDLLPLMAHGRLTPAERDAVTMHVASCADCRAELALLQAAQRAIDGAAPRVDATAIARAVESAVQVRRAPVRRWASAPLRAAAAVVIMALGATGVWVARRDAIAVAPIARDSVASIGPTVVALDTERAVQTAMAETVPNAAKPIARATVSTALGASFGDLSDEEMAAVIDAVDRATDVGPSADPTPTPNLVTSGTVR